MTNYFSLLGLVDRINDRFTKNALYKFELEHFEDMIHNSLGAYPSGRATTLFPFQSFSPCFPTKKGFPLLSLSQVLEGK